MTVLIEKEIGYFLCHRRWSSSNNKAGIPKMILCKDLFEIDCPFLFDLQAQKIAKNWFNKEKDMGRPMKNLPKDELEIIEHVSEIVRSAKEAGYLRDSSNSCDYHENNKKAREFVKCFLSNKKALPYGKFSSTDQKILSLNGTNYLFFPNASAVVCNILSIDVSEFNDKFNLIVIDPPWVNKMVSRKRKRNESHGYDLMEIHEIQKLPVKDLLSENGLVALWCTNKAAFRSFALQKFFECWNVELVATWYWIKVTTSGELTTPIGKNKKPFEILLLGRNKNCVNYKPVPSHRIIVSIPAAIHSFKPPLDEVLKPYIQDEPRCLEMFSRSLIPNWTSIGLEAFQLQDIALYEPLEENK
ncbi:N(6)-adenine-specific methyltransferase METTL4-like [Artemia franciscana]|uniref:Methyltransferase-like protein 4 n=1 Tax=Artemia franciscana TaxID=6661 RepID=A0AA88L377_ARTSF|nr:hypothetical protein QYM36_007353 [Artemia franciscana]